MALGLTRQDRKAYSGARNAREIDNFLWNVERYFEAVGITEDAVKLRTVPLYLGDVATVWWRRRCEDIKKGTCTISTWGEFTKELKGSSTQRMPKRRGVQDLATAMAAAESLIEFKRKEPSKDKGKKPDRGHKTGGGDKSKQGKDNRWNKGARDKAKEKEGESPRAKFTCFICNGPHRAFECPKRGKLAALVSEETEPSEERHVASLQLLSAIKAKVKGQNQGRMLVEAGVHGTPVVALVDTGADTIYMSTQLADEIRLPYEKVQGSVKGVTAESMPISGVARNVSLQIGQWEARLISPLPHSTRRCIWGSISCERCKHCCPLCRHHVHHATWTALLCANKEGERQGQYFGHAIV
ncbi:hypothetical protein GH714_031229 [Hevea brasiliensis]|uniref:Retrotransposon gag domain-containing protein n=1 Tax=Hevea brasiliensis TaxID=3981 RepID=A0A6A6N9F3_HEVBR|nr:hypothetical protein GH714_031229 [Hevea brasiliensis]